MELCLNGQQINLATRYKPLTAPVNYPNKQRFGSVERLNVNLRKPRYNIKPRPQSADNLLLQNQSSSSNILKLLLSDRIDHFPDPMDKDVSGAEESDEIEEELPSPKEFLNDQNTLPEPNFLKRKPPIFPIPKTEDQSKLDLPGRVSFSGNNVFEVDYSDYSDGSVTPPQFNIDKKTVRFEVNKKAESHQSTIQEEPSLDIVDGTEEPSIDSSTKIIEDYKQEIMDLQRQHEAEMSKLENENKTEKLNQNQKEEQILEIKTTNEQKTETIKSPALTQTKTATWDTNQESDLNEMGSSEDNEEPNPPKLPVKINPKINRPKSSTKPVLRTPPQFNIQKSKPPIPKKITANKKKEVNNLGEYQMDKIDSWMSIQNELKERKREKESKTDYEQILSKNHPEYNKDWRNTPSSKTDDEGNYSLEDHDDCCSNESTTYDEMVTIIKEIEAEKRTSTYLKEIQDVEFKLNTELMDEEVKGTNCRDQVKQILNFLDDVELNCEKTISTVRVLDSDREEFQFAIDGLDFVDSSVPKMDDLLLLPNRHLARRIVSMFLRTNELSNALQLAKDNNKTLREEKQKAIRLEKLNSQKALSDQKKHFENIVNRHQIFVEQLLKDKSSLCEKVAVLTRRMDSQNQAWEHKLDTEVNRIKETVLASEKIKRERWAKENTKKIKDLTVKGLELEINKLTEKYNQDIMDMKLKHQEEMLAKAEELRIKFEQMEKNIRESHAEDREAIIEKERNVLRDRYERQLAADQTSFEEQKIRMISEWNIERERLLREVKVKDQSFEDQRDLFVKERNELLDRLRKDHHEAIKALNEQHKNEIESVRDHFEKDFAIWKCEFENTQKMKEIERENKIRNECRQERDNQIDNIVAKIDYESQKAQQDHDLKLRRMRDKYEIDLKELEVQEARSREKYLEMRQHLSETEAKVQKLDIELNHTKEMYNTVMIEKEHIAENSIKDIQHQIESMRKDHSNEIQQIYSRVQKAIQKKDSTLELVQKENLSLKERCLKLEAIIRQQRKDYCIK